MSLEQRMSQGPRLCLRPPNSALSEAEVTIPEIACKNLIALGLIENALYEVNFIGPNMMTPRSAALPGIEVQTQYARSNDKGVLTISLNGLRSVRCDCITFSRGQPS